MSSDMSTASSKASRKCAGLIYTIEVHADIWINTSVEFPDDTVQTLKSTEHVHIEQDGAVSPH